MSLEKKTDGICTKRVS